MGVFLEKDNRSFCFDKVLYSKTQEKPTNYKKTALKKNDLFLEDNNKKLLSPPYPCIICGR